MSLLDQLASAYLGTTASPYLVGRVLKPLSPYLKIFDRLADAPVDEDSEVLLRLNGTSDILVCHRNDDGMYAIAFPPDLSVCKYLNNHTYAWEIRTLPDSIDPLIDAAAYRHALADPDAGEAYFAVLNDEDD